MGFVITIVVVILIWIYFKWVTKPASQINTKEPIHFYTRAYNEMMAIGKQYKTTIDVYLAGTHISGRGTHIRKNMEEGSRVKLIAEPGNKFDPNAIMVVDVDKLIGYIPEDKAQSIKVILNKEHVAFIGSIEEEDSYSSPGTKHVRVYLKIFYN